MEQKENRKEKREAPAGEQKRFDLDTFGEIVDKFIHNSAIGVAVYKEEKTDDWQIDGAGLGPVIDFYVYLHGLETLLLGLLREMKRQDAEIDPEKLVPALMEIVSDGLLEAAKKMDGEEAADDAGADPDGTNGETEDGE